MRLPNQPRLARRCGQGLSGRGVRCQSASDHAARKSGVRRQGLQSSLDEHRWSAAQVKTWRASSARTAACAPLLTPSSVSVTPAGRQTAIKAFGRAGHVLQGQRRRIQDDAAIALAIDGPSVSDCRVGSRSRGPHRSRLHWAGVPRPASGGMCRRRRHELHLRRYRDRGWLRRARVRSRPQRRAAPRLPQPGTSTTPSRRSRPRRRRPPARWRRGCRTSARTRSRSRTQQPAGAAVHQPGPEPGLRVQPRRGAPRVPRGGAAGSEPGDGLLGAGAGARPEHQRGDGAQRGAAGLRAGAAGADAADARHRCASAPTSTPWRSATPARPRIGGRATRPTPRRCASCTRTLSRRSRRRDALRRVGDGPAAVGLLAARRRPARRHRRRRGADRARDRAQPEASGRAAHVHPPDGGDRHARKGRARRRHAADADAGGRAHGPHAGAHLSARRPLRRRDQEQPAGDRRRRGLHHAVPRAGPVSRWPTTRTTSTSCGSRRRSTARARWPSSRRASWRPRSTTRR